MNIRIADVVFDSIVDGKGLRDVVFVQGCKANCPGCHNPGTHDPSGGQLKDITSLVSLLTRCKLSSGLTISGGEPFLQPDAVLELITKYKEARPDADVWIYSGFAYEELLASDDEATQAILKTADVLVDGRFMEGQKTLSLPFRGSKNQRIIELKGAVDV